MEPLPSGPRRIPNMSPERQAEIRELLRTRPTPAVPALTCRQHGHRAPEARPLDCAFCLADLQAELPRLFAALTEQAGWIQSARRLLYDMYRRREAA